MILRIQKAKVCGRFSLDLAFNDGTRKQVNVKSLLRGRIFQPLKKEIYFLKMKLNADSGTVCWPNGADFAPESLRGLKAENLEYSVNVDLETPNDGSVAGITRTLVPIMT